jgi:tRNA nucleotidyltransferase (CCA-adding enzyme)
MTRRERDIDPTRLPARLAALEGIDQVREAARRAGIRAYLVGGSVRDLLIGAERADIDVAVEGDPMLLAAQLGGAARSHERFATATARIGEHVIDLAATRTETYPHPGALPEVSPASLAEDLARRDFTINAMAVRLVEEPQLIDAHGGLADLRAGVLRHLHDRSFVDDPTRALRAARYAARIELEPEARTLEHLRATDLATVSEDRVDAELRRLATEDRARRGFELLADWGLVDLPGGAGELIDAIVAISRRAEWARLDHRADAVLAVVSGADVGGELASARPASPSEAVRLAHGRRPEDLLAARARGAEWLDRYVAQWRWVRLEITGHDLLDAGIPEGPGLGRGLAAALEAKLDGDVSGHGDELRVALEAADGERARGDGGGQ